ncbi:universal stress protein [Rhodobacterales bacterium 52_120_T64]|nr:universal stress protein [Rhodobacterales bacterium 52_120_T64]
MYKKILISMSLDHGYGDRAIEMARALSAEGGEIFAVHVYEALQGTASTYVSEEDVEKALAHANTRIVERVENVSGVKPVLLTGHSGRALTDYATKVGADCILIGAHKPGLRDFFLGSTAARIVRHAPCSVHVLR